MSFYGLLDAMKPTACYYMSSKKLVLTASGKAPEATSSIGFAQQTFMGGLKFNFGGWTGPLVNPPQTFSYTRSSAFAMDLPNPVTPSNIVIICCKNNPDGEMVKIDFIEEPSVKSTMPAMEPGMARPPQGMMKGDEMMTVLYRMPFNIMAKAVDTPDGACTITFDPNMLCMTNSCMKADNMMWMFDSMQTGMTQVIVNTDYGTLTMRNERKCYDVRIVVLEDKEKTMMMGTRSGMGMEKGMGMKSGMGMPKNMEMPMNWMGMVNMGFNMIQKTCPKAEMMMVECMPMHHGPVYHPMELSQMKMMCRQADGKGMACVKSMGWGEWGMVTMMDMPMTGLANVMWPCKIDMVKAYELMCQKMGMGTSMGPGMMKCELKRMLYPGVEEGCYFFEMMNGGMCSVGCMTGKVAMMGRMGEMGRMMMGEQM